MSTLKVSIVADGVRREFSGSGDGPAVVAAFRVWLSNPDFYLPMAEGADELDAAAARLEDGKDAPVLESEVGDVVKPPAANTPIDTNRYKSKAGTNGTSIVESAKLRGEILRVLASGASYDPKEIARNIRGAYPDINHIAIAPVLEHMVREQQIRRVPTDFGGVRYQAPATARGRRA